MYAVVTVKQLFLLIFCAMTTFAQDIAEPPEEDAPVLVLSDGVISLRQRMRTAEMDELASFKTAKDKASADAAAVKLAEVYRRSELLAQELNDTAVYEEVLASLYAYDDSEYSVQIIEELLRLRKCNFYDSADLKAVLPEYFMEVNAEPKQLPPKEEAGFIVMDGRLRAAALIYLVKNRAGADEVAAKLLTLQKKEEKVIADVKMSDEEFERFRMDYYDQDTVLFDHKELQKERLQKADYFGSALLKKAYEFWDERIPYKRDKD